ncbi:MAG: hypothetical protein XU10_C0002G0037 [Chloroflexi bacterium CSP1-4]|nr:MAG: hypothetical protein XU10_C0002G0037 [Chloroflexi bacterium CSP1-4]
MGLGSVAAPSADAVPGAAVRGRRVLVGGVGYTNLRDLSAGPLLVERLACLDWPAGVDVEDLSAGAVHVLHALQAAEPYDAMILVAGVRRGDAPGTVRCAPYRPSRRSDDEIQGWVAEAVTGLISLDALLAILGRFEALPPRVTVIEVEPRDEDWGPVVSEPVQVALAAVETLVRREVEKWLA